MADSIESFQEALLGMKVSHVWRGYGSALFVEFGLLSASKRRDGSPSHPSGQITAMIEWDWRIEEKQSIICGSCSDEELWQPTFDKLIGRECVGVSTFGRLPEIAIALSGDFWVSSFKTAEGNPAWTLFDRRQASGVVWISIKSGEITTAG
jgi:hypothetical protein